MSLNASVEVAKVMQRPLTFSPFSYSTRQKWVFAILFLVYGVLMHASHLFAPSPAILFPASAVALSVLFLEGVELWPAVYAASFLGNVIYGSPLEFILFMPIAQAFQAFFGAYMLRSLKLDPIFRRSRDMFKLFLTVTLSAAIVPSMGILANALYTLVHGVALPHTAWGLWYTANIFSFLVIIPFLLRWFAKPRFSRKGKELWETLAVFGVLIFIDALVFIGYVKTIGGITLVYFLLIPLFWIALRLRPRFVTLSLVITAAFAIASLYFGPDVPSTLLFNARLFQIEVFLIVLASIFLIVVSLEEDRRLTSNLMISHLQTLENAVARISSESKAKNDFIAVLAHELRNPLAPVVSAIDFLKLKHEKEPEDAEMLAMMEGRMQTVRRLLDDLLDISRIAEGKITLRKERIKLSTVISRAVLSTEHHYKERHQSLTVTDTKSPLVVEGDGVRLEQIFSNLLTNASKYSNSGDTISLSTQEKNSVAEIIVTDTGVGIDADILEEIFKPFHQAELGARTRKGLGIGLALVRNFVEMHGGTVFAESAGSGHGSRFTVRLPLAGAGIGTVSVSEHVAQAQSKNAAHGLRVLVVDDNDAAAWSIGKLLELRGCRVGYAYDGSQALSSAALLSPNVILLDVGLPDRDGYAVAKSLRARGFKGKLIALTGFGGDEARLRGRDTGFEYYLVKPASLTDLIRVMPEIA